MNHAIRVVLFDENSAVRYGIQAILSGSGNEDIEIVRNLDKQLETVPTECRNLDIDILILGLEKVDNNTEEVLTNMKRYCPKTRVLLLLNQCNKNIFVRLLNTYENIFMCAYQSEITGSLPHLIRYGEDCKKIFSGELVYRVIEDIEGKHYIQKMYRLSNQEFKILQRISEGKTNTEIATQLGLADQTVRNYTTNIYTKIGVNSRTELILWSRDNLS